MLVTCPECGAKYEIEDSLIPPSGRKVQCSACDHVWNEVPRAAEAGARGPAGGGAAGGGAAATDEETAETETGEAEVARPPLPEEVKAILREEAAREARLRRERGLGEIRPDPKPDPGAAARSRRPHAPAGPLPDPEAMQATLHAADAGHDSAHPVRRGFFVGLFAGLCLVAVAALVYAAAPRLAAAVPAAAPALSSYVAFVDDLRLALDAAVSRAGDAFSGSVDA